MNKKFSTLVATLLLSGALFTLNAATFEDAAFKDKYQKELVGGVPTYKFTSDVTLAYGQPLIISEDNVVIDGQNNQYTLNGQIIITGENVTIKNLNVIFVNEGLNGSTPGIDGTTPQAKNAILLVAKSGTLTGNVIKASAKEATCNANAICVLPTDAKGTYSITGNTVTAQSITSHEGAGKTVSAGIVVWANMPAEGYTEGSIALDTPIDLSKNIYKDCSADFLVEVLDESWNTVVESIQVTPLVKNGEIINGAALTGADGLNYSTKETTVIFNGTVEQFTKSIGETEISKDVAVVCDGANVLFGNAENPDNGQGAIINGILPLEEEVFGYELSAGETSEYSMLVLRSNNPKANGAYYVITVENGAAVAKEVTNTSEMNALANDKNVLWSMSSGKDADGTLWYKFKNQNGVELKASANGSGQETIFRPVNNAKYNNGVVFNVDGLDLGAQSKNYFGLYSVANNVLTVKDLNWFEQDGFSVTITCDKNETGDWDNDELEGNVFTGHLTPMALNGDEFDKAADGAKKFALMNEDGKFIVAKKYASNGQVTAQSTYTFELVSEEDLIHDIKDADKQNYSYLFQAEVSAKYTDYKKLTAIDVLKVYLPNGWAKIGRLDLTSDEVPTLAASVQTALKPIKIALGSNLVVNPKTFLQKGKFYTVEKLTGDDKGKLAVAGDDNNYSYAFVKSYGNVLEGQWALTYEGGRYVFRNREYVDGGSFWMNASTLYYTDEENVYKSGENLFKIETVAEHAATDGYDNETLKDVKNNKFYIGFSSNVFGGNAWFVENHEGDENHVLGLDINQAEALTFTATEYAAPRTKDHVNHTDVYTASDSIYVISNLGYYDGNTYKTTQDTLKIVSYSFVNQFNEPLVYNWSDHRYESKVYKDAEDEERYETVAEAAKDADRFAIRLDGTKKNLRLASTYVVSDRHHCFNSSIKMYAGDAANGVLSTDWLYSRTENDLFVIEPTERAMYRTVINPLDVISIFRNDNHKSILFEDGMFLGMENIAQFEDIAPAMLADTAYVRNNTYRPQYMLAVNPKVVPAGKWCPIHGDDPTCPDAHKQESKGWVEARYLVNLVDTAIAWDQANKHKDNNPYINTEKYYRLGFVQAKHIEDSLVIASTNDTLIVGTEDFNQAKFAFRYDNQEEGSFRIETANYKRLPNVDKAVRDGEGYVKWMNGVVVVVDDIKDADIFNMKEDEDRTPTANDEIAASEVSIIAANGSIIVKGAAGKTVAISNILGQTIANAVVSSDNETIAVPAGIAVVAVEGEEAVKVVVK